MANGHVEPSAINNADDSSAGCRLHPCIPTGLCASKPFLMRCCPFLTRRHSGRRAPARRIVEFPIAGPATSSVSQEEPNSGSPPAFPPLPSGSAGGSQGQRRSAHSSVSARHLPPCHGLHHAVLTLHAPVDVAGLLVISA